MTSVSRRPLAARPPQSLAPAPSPARHLKSAQLPKRPRSPDSAAHNLGSLIKRHKPTLTSTSTQANPIKKERKPEHAKLKEQQRAEREQQRLEFKEKYCRAFPNWTFHLDTESMESEHQLESFQSRIQQLGAVSCLVCFFPDFDLMSMTENRAFLLSRDNAFGIQSSCPESTSYVRKGE